MQLAEIAEKLGLQALTPGIDAGARDVTAGYVSDLLSDVLANAPKGGLLVTVQVHLNVIAVSVHAELAGVIFALDREPEPAVCERAIEERIALYRSSLPSWEIVGRLYALGLRGE